MSEDVTIRAARAEQLLADEVLREALKEMNDDAAINATVTPLNDAAKCVAAVAAIRAAGEFEAKLLQYITAGKAAERKPYKVA
jgi:Arc/MetJ-type ribon-helix-helix transcriptional regulator